MIVSMLVLAHIGGDFFFLSDRLAKIKQDQRSALIRHSLIYATLCLLTLLLSVKFSVAIWTFFVLVISHFLIDFAKNTIEKMVAERFSFMIFIVDQILHIATILIVYTAGGLSTKQGSLLLFVSDWFGTDQVHNFLIYSMIYLIMLKPMSVTIRKLLEYIEIISISEHKTQKDVLPFSSLRAGSYIGMLERVITVTLIMQLQWGAVGFVLTAKSLARFRQLEDKDFAEKYLIGTLSSLAGAIFFALLFTKYVR